MRAAFTRPTRGTVVAVAVSLALAIGCFVYADRAAPGRKSVERVEAAVAEGKSIHWRNVTRVWLPRAAFINGWLMLAAAAMVPWARRSLAASGVAAAPAAHPDSPQVRRLGWLGVAVLAGVAAWSTAPRLGQSVWGDEARSLREFIVGQFHTDETGARTFDEATWGDAFFNFRTPNNHVLYSLVARAAHVGLARPPVEATDAYFSEMAMRFPAWLGALAAVFGVAGLGAVLGWRRAGWVAAALLVLHPGFVRYAAEARGYSLLLLFGPLLTIALLRAVQTGRWRWWWAAAALDFAMIYTWPLSVHFVAVANGGAIAALWIGRGWQGRDRVTLLVRWGVTGLVAAAVWLQFFLPNVMQLRIWLRGSSAKGTPGDGGWIDALSALLTGRVWRDADATNPLLTPWVRTWETHHWLVVGAGALLLGALCFGVTAVWRRTPAMRPWLPAMLLPPLTILGQAGLSGSVLYPWYLMVGVPGALLLVAIGLDTAVRLTRSNAGQAASLSAGVALFALMGSACRDHLRRHPIEPNREASLLVQPVINPHHPDYQRHALTGGFFMSNTIYDPGVRFFENVAQLRSLMDEARGTGRDFVVIYGQRELARRAFPEIMAVLEDPAEFHAVATLYGQEGYCTRYIAKHPAATR